MGASRLYFWRCHEIQVQLRHLVLWGGTLTKQEQTHWEMKYLFVVIFGVVNATLCRFWGIMVIIILGIKSYFFVEQDTTIKNFRQSPGWI